MQTELEPRGFLRLDTKRASMRENRVHVTSTTSQTKKADAMRRPRVLAELALELSRLVFDYEDA